MKRLLTTLMILLVVIVAGLSALILLVNPNDFRAYMVQQVEERSGYQLKLEGPLRWHVWPQLSILSGRMSLTAPGASQPVVSAENMRLDVALMPLLSHQLRVNQVMIKDAVVQLTPQSQKQTSANAPVAPKDNQPAPHRSHGWSFDIGKLQVVDSVLVLQRPDEEQITVRNINLDMQQDANKQAQIELSSQINRDQRDLSFSLEASLDLSDYPNQLNAQVSSLSYQYQGAGLLAEGIKGTGEFQLHWKDGQGAPELSLSVAQFSANDSDLQGDVSYTQGETADLVVNLHARQLNIDNLLINDKGKGPDIVANQPRPVVAEHQEPDYQGLRTTNAVINLSADSLRWRGLNLTGLQTQLTNHQGLLTIEQLNGTLGSGTLSLPGSLDVRNSVPEYRFQPQLKNIDMGTILGAFDYPQVVNGRLSLTGNLTGHDLSAAAFRNQWQGDAKISLNQARLEGMNFQQLIQQAVSRSTDGISILNNYDNTTALDSLSTQARLNNGNVTLNALSGQSSMLSLTGSGNVNLVREVCDMEFHIRVNGGWQGSNNKLISLLESASIPLRVYGPWQQLSYSLPIEQILRNLLQNNVKQRVSQWLDNNVERRGVNDIKQLLDGL